MDHELLTGANETHEFIVRRYDGGTTTVSTRPLGGLRWSPEVVLTRQAVEVPC